MANATFTTKGQRKAARQEAQLSEKFLLPEQVSTICELELQFKNKEAYVSKALDPEIGNYITVQVPKEKVGTTEQLTATLQMQGDYAILGWVDESPDDLDTYVFAVGNGNKGVRSHPSFQFDHIAVVDYEDGGLWLVGW